MVTNCQLATFAIYIAVWNCAMRISSLELRYVALLNHNIEVLPQLDTSLLIVEQSTEMASLPVEQCYVCASLLITHMEDEM